MEGQRNSRRKNRRKTVLPCIAGFFLLLLLWTLWQNLTCGLTEYALYSPDLPAGFDGYRILQISDFHSACFGNDNEALIRIADEACPDIIVITGDLVSGDDAGFDRALSFAARLCGIAPVCFVSGNHEYCLDKADREYLYAGLEERGVTLLEDESLPLIRGNEQITLIGLRDLNFFHRDGRAKMKAALSQNMPEEGFTVLLAHRPYLLDIYAECGADIVLSGHSHGGQVRLPFIGGIYTSDEGFFPEYTGGVHRQGDTCMVISRGIGSSLFPVRFNNRPEMVLVELRTADRAAEE